MSLPIDESGPTAGQTHDRRADAGSQGGQRRDEQATSGRAVDRSPARLSAVMAIGFALLAALTVPSIVLVLSGLCGALLVGAGAVWGTRRVVGYGTVLLLGGVLVAGTQGAPPEPLLFRTLLALLAWDAGRYGIVIGEQLGRDADTRRIELAHSAFAAAVGAAGTGLGYATYRVMVGGRPVAAVLLMLFGAVVLVFALRDRA